MGELEEDDGAIMFFISKKQQKAISNFSLDSLIITNSITNGTSKNIKSVE